jgi:hypothetical protein
VRGRPLTDAERQRGFEFDDAHASGSRISRARPLSADEHGNAKKHKSSTMGDGPGKFDHLFRTSSIPGARTEAPSAVAPAPPLVAVAPLPAGGVSVPPPPAPPRAAHAFDRFAHLFPTPSNSRRPHSSGLNARVTRAAHATERPSVTRHALLHGGPGHRSSVKAAARIRLVTTAARKCSLADVVKNDISPHAIRPHDLASFGALLANTGKLLEEPASQSTHS